MLSEWPSKRRVSVSCSAGHNFSGFFNREITGHGGGGRIGAMRRMRDEQHVTPAIPPTAMIRLDHLQTNQFALGAGHRLCGHCDQTGNRLKIFLNMEQYFKRALRIFDGRCRM